MAAKSELEVTLSGNFSDFTQELDRPYSTEIEHLGLVNRLLFFKVDDAYDTMRPFFDKRIKEVAGDEFNTSEIHDPAYAMFKNAVDSVTERLPEADYVVNLQLRMSFDGDEFCFEVEDNGTGILPNIEPILYKGVMLSPKKDRPELCGGHGADLTLAKDKVYRMKGTLYHKNKGENQGAIFGYSLLVSLQSKD